jgi:hypothetical protein
MTDKNESTEKNPYLVDPASQDKQTNYMQTEIDERTGGRNEKGSDSQGTGEAVHSNNSGDETGTREVVKKEDTLGIP